MGQNTTNNNDDANIREDPDRKDNHSRRGTVRYDRQRQDEDTRQGGDPTRPTTPYIRRKTTRGRPNIERLQHPKREHAAPCFEAAGRRLRSHPCRPREGIQLRKERLQEVLRASSSAREELPQEGM